MRIIPRNILWVLRNGLLLLLLMSLLRVVFWLVFPNPSPQNPTNAFVLGFRYDVRIVAIPVLCIWLLSCIPVLNPFINRAVNRLWNVVYLILLFVLLLFYAADFGHYAYLHQRLNASLLGYLQDTLVSTEMIWQSYPIVTGLFVSFLFLLLMYAILRYNFRRTNRFAPVTSKPYSFMCSLLFCLLLLFFIQGRAGSKPLRWSDAFATNNDYNANLSLNPFQSFYSTLVFKNPACDVKKIKASYPLMAAYFGVAKPDMQTLSLRRDVVAVKKDTLRQPLNVVLVICESFSAYKSSMWGNQLNTTPYFDSLCKQGVFFDRCFSPCYGTARGIWAIVTGVPDVSLLSTNSRRPPLQSQHTIINDFKNYERIFFTGGKANWANLNSLLQLNIDSLRLYEQDDYHAAKVNVWGISDKNVFLGANKVLAQEKKPFFAIIQTADNHRPYTIPPEDKQLFIRKQVPIKTLRQYGFESEDEYNAFRYTDFCFKEFMNAASREAYYNNTVFVFVGDHGIRGNAKAIFPNIWTQQGLTALHVPLLFYQPSVLQAKRLSLPASQMDVLPTIAGICGIGYTNTTMGMDLLDTARSAFYAQGKKRIPIFDDLRQQAGALQGNVFYEQSFTDETGRLFSSVDNNAPSGNTDSLSQALHSFTDAWIEWSRYLAENNKKLKRKFFLLLMLKYTYTKHNFWLLDLSSRQCHKTYLTLLK